MDNYQTDNPNSQSEIYLLLHEVVKLCDLSVNPGILIECFNAISHHRYETIEIKGRIALCPERSNAARQPILLTDPVPLTSIRGVRKLMEITSEEIALLCNGEIIYGLGDISKIKTGKLFIINFEKKGTWKLQQGGNTLLVMNDFDKPLPGSKVKKKIWKQWIKGIFTDISEQSQENMWRLFMAASEQKTGTNLLITENAGSEVSRLRNQSTLINPFRMTPEIIRQVTKIDGTVILDKNGICYAIGAILDGYASNSGNRARGGRYNSAIMYRETALHACAIMVISQDGDVDFVPALSIVKYK